MTTKRPRILRNIGTLARCLGDGGQGEIQELKDAAIAWNDKGCIEWIGRDQEIPTGLGGHEEIDAGGRLATPGLIDCHTHLSFAGWRAAEHELRILGRSYLEIEAAGGGIVSTVAQTRAASKEALIARGAEILKEMARLGLTTIEAKSGYGLDTATELKILEVYQALEQLQAISIVPTFLGAHTIPKEFRDNREDYLSMVLDEMLPAVAERKLAKFCDVFMEASAFTGDEARRVLERGKSLGLTPKIHADQFSDSGGARLAAEVNAASADHLEWTGSDGVAAMAAAGTVAVLLPFAALYTNQRPPNARAFIDAGVPVAIATDFNPGSAPSFHLPFALSIACVTSRLTPKEALKGATHYAAKALLIDREVGSIAPGFAADIALFDCEDVNHWLYHIKANCCAATFKAGVEVR